MCAENLVRFGFDTESFSVNHDDISLEPGCLALQSKSRLEAENAALRHQLAVLTRSVKRPQFRSTDRLFWILLAKGWQDWRSALIVVQPDTVVRCTANGFAGIGPDSHNGGAQAVQPRVRQFARSSTR